MKSSVTVLAIAVIAALIVFGQRLVVTAGDQFTVVGPQNHKVFRYGFPFDIVECSSDLSIRTPDGQVPLRVAGNFGVFFAGGLLMLGLVRFRRRHCAQAEG